MASYHKARRDRIVWEQRAQLSHRKPSNAVGVISRVRQFRGHSIPVERLIFYMGSEAETSKRRHIDGNNIEPKIVSSLAMEFAQTAPLG
jgi:hypothetical protein